MNYKLLLSARFQRQAKRLVKKYPSLKFELINLKESLLQNPLMGTAIGNDCYKIRLVITSKGKGKSGGARVITHVYFKQNSIYLLSIYDKSEQPDISDKELQDLLGEI